MISAGEVDIGKINRLDKLSEMKAKQLKEINFLLYNKKKWCIWLYLKSHMI